MTNHQIKTGQIAALLVTFYPITKLVMLPAILASKANSDAWLSAAILLAADFAVLIAVTAACRMCSDASLAELLTQTVGKFAAKIILFVYGLYFLLRFTLPMLEQKTLFATNLYAHMPNFASTVPFLITACYAAYKGATALGRSSTLMVWFTVLSLVLLFGLALPAVKPLNLLPVGQNGFSPIGGAVYTGTSWFGDFVLAALFMGKIQPKNGRWRGMLAGGAVACGITLLFLLVTVGIFGDLTVRQVSAIAKIGKYNTTFANIGRLDWLPVIVLMLSLFWGAAAMLYAAITCFQEVFAVRGSLAIILPVAAVVLVALFLLRDDYQSVYLFVLQYWSIPTLILQYALPPFLPLLALVRNKRRAGGLLYEK